MSSSNIPNGNIDGSKVTQGSKTLELEKIYQKKSQIEHILLRPDTYIGSIETVELDHWVYDETRGMVMEKISYVPGLYKIFDEILVNAADNKQRDPSMNQIKIDINQSENEISIQNNGQGIPVAMHKEEKMYIPTMIFGHLLTSSNYDDNEEKVTGGRNGYGAKLCNIYSTSFTVETASSEYGKVFKQTWKNNMSLSGAPKVKDYSGKDYTKVTFSPDLAKFKMEKLDDGIVKLMTRRAYDVAATSCVNVILNGKKLPVHNFKQYVELFFKDKDRDEGVNVVYEKVNERWEVAVSESEGPFQQVSFVNSIATTKGGRHVDHVAEAIVKNILEKANKKYKGNKIKTHAVKSRLWLFVNTLIVNPTFDSQTKENMTTQVKAFGSKCVLSETFYKNIDKKLNILDNVINHAKFEDEKKLVKATGGKRINKLKMDKLEDANLAGGPHSKSCTLILTEGDSAKTLAVAGLSIVGRDHFGVFPLKGKILNVREATSKQVSDNAEINNVVKIVGLQYSKVYQNEDDLKSLRYGKIMIMTDQDQDGSHIKGLLINFIHTKWPSLLKLPFLEEFITPIVKATKGKEELSFFSLPEFEEWKKEKENWPSYKIKYYKGLGTSTSKEAKEYFNNMGRHKVKFTYSGPNDDTNIKMAFSKKCVEQRKEWLTQWMETVKQRREMGLPEDYLYEKDTTSVNYSDFINKELVLFSNSDNERSIPNVMDGFKPGQRKVLFTCLKRKIDKKEFKVAQLAGSVAELSAYHHGEVSLMGTIVNLAQNYVGSNNINILLPIGQFGTRLQGGKDQASSRYIFTMLSPLAKYIFHPDDEPLLIRQFDDNLKIEPVFYVPVIPMVLVNGAEGIGTGWSTKIPNFNPRAIIENLRRMLKGEEPKPLMPWYKNFRGTIEPYGASKYTVFGEIARIDEETLEITELPIGVWTETYKSNVLNEMCKGDGKTPASIINYNDYTTDTTVRFVVQMDRDKLRKAEEQGLHKFFKLQTTLHTSMMVAFDADCCLRRFETPLAVLEDYFKVRLQYYEKRKNYLEGLLKAQTLKLSNQARFICEKCDRKLIIENKKRIEMLQELQKCGYDPDPVLAWKMARDKEEALDAVMEDTESQDDESLDSAPEKEANLKYDYLLGMAMWSLTLERKNKLLQEKNEKLQEYDILRKKTGTDLWLEDLDALLKQLDIVEKQEEEDAQMPPSVKKPPGGRGKKLASKRSGDDNKPDPNAERIIPKLDAESMKKLEKAEKPKVKRVKKAENVDEEKDEFDEMIDKPAKSLKDRLGNSPELIEKKLQAKRKDLKQSKLNFKKESPKKRKSDTWTSDEKSEDEDSVIIGGTTKSTVRERTKRKTAAKVTYNFGDESGSASEAQWDSEEDEEFSPTSPSKTDANSAPFQNEAKDEEIVISGTDSEFESERTEPKNPGGSEAMFDSLLAGSDVGGASNSTKSSTNDVPPKKKAPVKNAVGEKSKPAPKRTKKKIDSDSDEDMNGKMTKKGRKNSDSDEDFDMQPKLPNRKRSRPRYTVDDSDDDDIFG